MEDQKAPKKTPKVAYDVAKAEIDAWLDQKKVYESTREAYKDNIDLLIDAMMNGDLTRNDSTNVLTHKLLFPDELGNEVISIDYRARLNDNTLKPYMQGVKAGDADGRLLGLAAALTSQPKALISKMDSADKKIMTAIAIFFL